MKGKSEKNRWLAQILLLSGLGYAVSLLSFCVLHPFYLFCWKSVEDGKLILKVINAFVHTPENQRYNATSFHSCFPNYLWLQLKYQRLATFLLISQSQYFCKRKKYWHTGKQGRLQLIYWNEDIFHPINCSNEHRKKKKSQIICKVWGLFGDFCICY